MGYENAVPEVVHKLMSWALAIIAIEEGHLSLAEKSNAL